MADLMTTDRENRIKENAQDEQTFRDVRIWLIKRMGESHYEVIKKLEDLVDKLKIEIDNEKRPPHKQNLENQIRRTEKDIMRLKQKTPQVLKQVQLMQRELDSEMK